MAGNSNYQRNKTIMIQLDGENLLPPDHLDECWVVGAKTFSRKEVAYLLYTQRAMLSNDLKAFCGNDLTDEMYNVLSQPRIPVF